MSMNGLCSYWHVPLKCERWKGKTSSPTTFVQAMVQLLSSSEMSKTSEEATAGNTKAGPVW